MAKSYPKGRGKAIGEEEERPRSLDDRNMVDRKIVHTGARYFPQPGIFLSIIFLSFFFSIPSNFLANPLKSLPLLPGIWRICL